MVKNGCCEYTKVQEECYFKKTQTNEPPKQKPTIKLLRETRRMMKISRNMQNQEEAEAYTKTAVSISQGYIGK